MRSTPTTSRKPLVIVRSIARTGRRAPRRRSQEKEQVRKRGLPPPLLGMDERGQAPLPDLFSFLTVLIACQHHASTRILQPSRTKVLIRLGKSLFLGRVRQRRA